MTGASKILTVSYGTFSCTLEGFDDPFNTMRAIAEYFRDLAAEDRYFGAEPPTPDAAMLHRIAEREINRRVEANIQENGVILRAGDVKVSMPQPFAEASVVTPGGFLPLQPKPTAERSFEDDSVTGKLIRLREAQAAAEKVVSKAAVPEDDTEAEAAVDLPMKQTDTWEAASHEATIASVMADIDAPAPQAAPVDDDVPVVAALPDTLPSVEASEFTQPLREESPVLPPVETEERAEIDAPAAHPIDPGAVNAHSQIPHDAAVETAAAGTSELVAAPDNDAILMATLGAMIDPEGDDDVETVPEITVAPPGESAPPMDVPPVARTQVEAPAPADSSPESPAEDLSPVTVVAAEAAPDASDAPQADTRAADRLQRARARVIKIRRTDAAALPVAEAVRDVSSETEAATVSALSPEAEAELQRELADLEADLDPGEKPANEVAKHVATHLPVPLKPADPGLADDAVNRLISQTNAAMEGPENKRRLAAIAHLKAAVAATFADRKSDTALAQSGPAQAGPAERMDPYREDLDRAVRPRKPALVPFATQDANPAASRPMIEARPAPLVLVSEQRIDRPAAAATPTVTPVRPRRVTTGVLASEARAANSDARSTGDARDGDAKDGDDHLSADEMNNIFADPTQPFAEFAESLGAVTMTDLIEAAAAYCELQLGRDQFTRPLLLQQIADLPAADDFNREDCLRGFGTLLRDGRIQKIKRGQFKLSGKSRYLAEARRQAG